MEGKPHGVDKISDKLNLSLNYNSSFFYQLEFDFGVINFKISSMISRKLARKVKTNPLNSKMNLTEFRNHSA